MASGKYLAKIELIMKTFRDKKDFCTQVSANDAKALNQIIELLGPLVKLEPIGHYAAMNAEEIWFSLVVQVCVMGSARPIERLTRDPVQDENFRRAVALSNVKNQQNPAIYLAQVLQNFSATRFHQKSADRLVTILNSTKVFQNGRVLLLDKLSHQGDVFQTRDQLTQRCPIFGLKSASDFMISVGLSHDVIALDTRVVGILRQYFDYNLNVGQVQSNREIYFSLEGALRKFCQEQQISLAFLDRLLFNFSNLSVIELVVKHSQLLSGLR